MQRGGDIYVIDNLSTGLIQNLHQHDGNGRFHFFQADIRDRDVVEKIITDIRPEVVFHLAAQINVRESIKNPVHDVEINILGTLNLLESMRKV